MFPPMRIGEAESVLRPMNCPHHILVYSSSGRSYRELPLRIAELGAMYRAERSGVVGGLSRVRAMTLNDGHVFCAPEHIEAEVAAMLGMIEEAYRVLGISAHRHRLSLRGEGGKYADDDALWAQAETVLRAALDSSGVAYEEAPGEAAFYGPKLDVQVRDPLGREETLSTIQLDFVLPGRFGLTYTAPDGKPRVPVMLHRSVISTMERLMAHLIEVHDGAFPPWLAPEQVAVLPVGEPVAAVHDAFAEAGLRVVLDDADRSLAARVRAARQQRIPYLAIVGPREAKADSVALRLPDGRQLSLPVGEAVALVSEVVQARWQRGQ